MKYYAMNLNLFFVREVSFKFDVSVSVTGSAKIRNETLDKTKYQR